MWMRSHEIDQLYYVYAPAFLSFCKYWPDDGLLSPKLVAKNGNNKTKDSCVRRSTYFISFKFM